MDTRYYSSFYMFSYIIHEYTEFKPTQPRTPNFPKKLDYI